MTTALSLLPDFALILLGLALRRTMHLGDHFWTGLEKLVYFVLFGLFLQRLEFIQIRDKPFKLCCLILNDCYLLLDLFDFYTQFLILHESCFKFLLSHTLHE